MTKTRDRLDLSYEDVQMLARFIGDTESAKYVPSCFIRVMEGEEWKAFRNELKREVRPADFKTFVETKYPNGLGTTLDTLRKLIVDDPKALTLYTEGVTDKKGKRATTDNTSIISIIPKATAGTSETYGLRRLHRNAPDLHEKVVSGELSVNAACIKAGFRKPMFSIPADVDGAVRAIRRRFTAAQVREIKEAL